MQQQPMETTVKTYSTPGDYQKDVQKMTAQGWSVQNIVDHQQNRSLAGKLLVPGGLFTKGKSQIVVTYQRVAQPQEQMPDGLPFWEKQKWIREHTPKGLSLPESIQWSKDHYNKK